EQRQVDQEMRRTGDDHRGAPAAATGTRGRAGVLASGGAWSSEAHVPTLFKPQPMIASSTAMIASTTRLAELHNHPGTSRFRSRCISLVSLTNARVITVRAGTSAAGMAGSAGR